VVAGEEIGWKSALFQPIYRPCRTRRQEALAIMRIADEKYLRISNTQYPMMKEAEKTGYSLPAISELRYWIFLVGRWIWGCRHSPPY